MENSKRAMVIVGIGDVFERFYFEALCKLKEDGLLANFDVFCVDDSQYWLSRYVRGRRKATVAKISGSGFEFIDKSEPLQKNRYDELVRKRKVHCVIIATPDYSHIADINEWLQGNCSLIVVEKPLSKNLEELRKLDGKDTKLIRAFDHYRGKLHERFRTNAFWKALYKELGSDITTFRFFCIEDFSGTHDEYLENEGRKARIQPELNGPIEISGRTKTLEQGMVFDLMSHMLAMIQYFAKPENIVVEVVNTGKYRGVSFKYGKEALIPNETLAVVKFTLPSLNGHKISGEAYLGKGVRGVKDLKNINIMLVQNTLPQNDRDELRKLLEGDVKILEFGGKNGKRILYFLKRGGKRLRIKANGRGKLEDFAIRDAHFFSLKQIVSMARMKQEGETSIESNWLSLFLTFDEARKNMQILQATKDKIISSKTMPYFLGYRENHRRNGEILRYPEYLDDILRHFG